MVTTSTLAVVSTSSVAHWPLAYCDLSRLCLSAAALGAEYVPFDQLLSISDFVIVTCALNDDTKGLFNEAAFKKMKKNAILINASRGGRCVLNMSTKELGISYTT